MRPRGSSCRVAIPRSRVGRSRWCCKSRATAGRFCTITRRRTRSEAHFPVSAVPLRLQQVSPPKDRVIALTGATLIDGAGGDPKSDALIIIRNGHIDAVARVNEISIPNGAEQISLVGKTVIPGLIDAHAHVERWATQRYIAWGVTTVR